MNTFELGFQGGYADMLGIYAGSFRMPRRRWPKREIDLGADLKHEPAEQIKSVEHSERGGSRQRPPELEI